VIRGVPVKLDRHASCIDLQPGWPNVSAGVRPASR